MKSTLRLFSTGTQFLADCTLVTVELLAWLSSVRPYVSLSVRNGCTVANG